MTSLADMPIIDIDTHWSEPRDLWSSRAPAKFKNRIPRIVDRSGAGSSAGMALADQQWVVDDDVVLGPAGISVIKKDGSKGHGIFSFATMDESTPGAWSGPARLADMARLGVHTQILYPNAVGFAGGAIMKVKDVELRNFCLAGYNDGAADLQKESGGRLLPQALLPFWDLGVAVKELKRCRQQLGLVGFTMTDSPQEWGLPTLNDRYWDPLWSTAQDMDLPVAFHIGSGGTGQKLTWDGYDPTTTLAVTSLTLFMNNMRCLTNLVFSGLLDRFPRLRILSVESGIGWVPFLIEACEYQYKENWGGTSPLKLTPREYFDRNIYTSFWFEKENVGHTIGQLGADNVLFETDYPHPTCLYPSVREHVAEALSGLSESVQRKVLYENAARVYHLPMPA